MAWSDGRPARSSRSSTVTLVSDSLMPSRVLGAAWGHFIARYLRAKSYHDTADFFCSIESGRPDSLSNSSPSRIARMSFAR